MFHYHAHGLHIASELYCPELAAIPDTGSTPDVIFDLGVTPAALANPGNQRRIVQAQPGEYLLKLPNIARFWVQNGDHITIEPAAGCTEDTIRLFLLGSALGALLHQRGQVILHGSAVTTERGAVVFVGPSGVGKSTLAAALHQRGYRALADDVCSISFDEASRQSVVPPGLAHIKLWADAAEHLALSHAATRRLRPELEKYALPISADFDTTPVPLHAVYILDASNQDEFKLTPLPQLQKMESLLANTYRQGLLAKLGMRQNNFQQLTRIAGSTKVARLTRPKAGFRMDELIKALECDWARN